MSQLALTRKNSTRRCTQLTCSSIDASRCGMSASISDARVRNPNSTVAEMRESVENGATVSGETGGLSAANALELIARRPSAASPTQVDRVAAERPRRCRKIEVDVMMKHLVGLSLTRPMIERRRKNKYGFDMRVSQRRMAGVFRRRSEQTQRVTAQAHVLCLLVLCLFVSRLLRARSDV